MKVTGLISTKTGVAPKRLITSAVATKVKGVVKTAIHFEKDDSPERAIEIEQSGRDKGLDTGAFVAVRWEKPRSM